MVPVRLVYESQEPVWFFESAGSDGTDADGGLRSRCVSGIRTGDGWTSGRRRIDLFNPTIAYAGFHACGPCGFCRRRAFGFAGREK